ncbi:MAG: META domain-containing protein [Sporocytophaga sp.]|uniref:META domain-containing protein n=1 Tax=Sporocytophaga sp. TaxID=2231183 RepID=UPI001B0D1C42|nr:META domain-containing protein [Sporocytophaga sp.]MBO9701997.1 META domain-containing protein [Sporocytophaga sp.]
MKWGLPYIFAILLFFFGCQQNHLNQNGANPWVPNAELYGLWSGSWPCSDCDVLAYKLTIQRSGLFREEAVKINGKGNPQVLEGTWQMINDSVLILNKMDGSKAKFLFKRNELGLLNEKGSSVRNQYILYRSDAEVKLEESERMRKGGVDFITDLDEKWKLIIDFEKEAVFYFPDGEVIKAALNDKIDPDRNTWKFTSSAPGSFLSIELTKDICIDSISGESIPYKVLISAEGLRNKGVSRFSGCGSFLGDWRLHDIWALRSFNGKQIDAANFDKGIPYLEFNIREGKIFGNAGCNAISGSFIQSKSIIAIGSIASTKMLCNAYSFEQGFLSALSQKNFKYKFDGLKLTLSDEKSVLEFSKVD